MTRNIIWGIALISGVAGLSVLGVFTYILIENYDLNGSLLPSETGITGDFIGGVVGTLWGLTGVLLFYLALTYQRAELELQREELSLQREEMKETRKVIKEQSETMKIQKFETTFFNLVKNHSELVKNITLSGGHGREKFEGYEVIDSTYEVMDKNVQILESVKNKKIINSHLYLEGYLDKLVSYVGNFESICEDILLIVEFIESNKLDSSEFYHKLLYNSLQPNERILLGFYIEHAYELTNIEQEVKENLQIDYYFCSWENIISGDELPPKITVNMPRGMQFNSSEIQEEFDEKIKEVKLEIHSSDEKDILISRIMFNHEEYEINVIVPPKSLIEIFPFKNISALPAIPRIGKEFTWKFSFTCVRKGSTAEYSLLENLRIRKTSTGIINIT